VGVPMSIPRQVERGAACLADERLWGVPRALQATVWAGVPGVGPAGVDPFAVLRGAARRGQQNGVRTAGALFVQTAMAAGRVDDARQGIREHAESLRQRPPAEAWRTLDRYATLAILHESDRLWTQARGYRTPSGALGTFAEDAAAPADGRALDGLETEEGR